MKKTLTILALSILSASAFAQGQISVNDTAGYKISVNGVQMGTTANSYYFDVLEWYTASSPTTVSSLTDLTSANWLDTGAYGWNNGTGPRAGTIDGATTVTPPSGPSQTSPYQAYYVIVGWSSTVASDNAGSWANVVSAITGNTEPSGAVLGWSAVTPLFTGTVAPANGALLFSAAGLTTGFNMVPVPEPTTMALIGLGGLSLLLFRRRQ